MKCALKRSPCFLGRSGSAYSNERRCDPGLRNPGFHVLVAQPPGVVFLHSSQYNGPWGRRGGLRCPPCGLGYFRKLDPLSSVVHLRRSILPFAYQRLAFRRTIAAGCRLQLQVTPFAADHPVVADGTFRLQPKDLTQFSGRRSPPVIVLRLGCCSRKTAIVCRQILVFQKLVRGFVSYRSLSAAFS